MHMTFALLKPLYINLIVSALSEILNSTGNVLWYIAGTCGTNFVWRGGISVIKIPIRQCNVLPILHHVGKLRVRQLYSLSLKMCPQSQAMVTELVLCFLYSEETAKLEDLQDKNIGQKEVLRDTTAKIEVIYYIIYVKLYYSNCRYLIIYWLQFILLYSSCYM